MKKTSKTVFVLMIMLISLFSIASLASADEETPAGGWVEAEDKSITAERKELFEKAVSTLTGAQYEPVSYEASQVVAGKNHKFTANRTLVIPNAETVLVEVIIYEDTSGNVSVVEINELGKKDEGNLSGGWVEAEDKSITAERKELFEKAVSTLAGAKYEAVSYEASQVVAGKNHKFTANRTLVIPNAETVLVEVIIYEDTSGNVSVIEIDEIESKEDPKKDDSKTDDSKKDDKKEDTPKTGDSANIIIFSIIALACVAVVVLIASRRRQSL